MRVGTALLLSACVALGGCDGEPEPAASPSRETPSATRPGSPATTSVPSACGATTTAVLLPTGAYGLRAGPFGFLGRSEPHTRTEVPGPPTKVVFSVLEAYDEEYVVTGVGCDHGDPMRFWYGRSGTPVPTAPAGTAGELEARIPPTPSIRAPGSNGHGGYLLPSSPGRWRLDFSVGGRVTHSVVVDLVFRR